MNAELEEFKKLMVRKARLQSIVLGVAAVITVLFMIYGFTQSIEAGRQRDIAIENEKAANEAKIEALNQKGMADILRQKLDQCESEKNK